MSLKIRRGTEVERTTKTFDSGELVWTASDGGTGANYHQLWVGDGVTPGGVNILATSAGTNLLWDATTRTLKVDLSSITTDNIAPGSLGTRQYYSRESAQDDAALLFSSGTHVGITFQYIDSEGKINATVDASAFTDQIGITAISQDTAPALGGDLHTNGHNISGTGNIDVTGDITASGSITANAYGNVNAKQITLTDKTGLTIANAGFVLSTNIGGDSGSDFFSIKTHHNDADPVTAVFSRSKGTANSPTALANGDAIFNLGFFGTTTGGSIAPSVGIGAQVDGIVAPGVLPGKFVVYTSNSSGAFTQALSIDKTQTAVFTGRVLVPDGTAGIPSLAFTSDASQDTGFFHPQDGVVCVSTNAQERVRIDDGGMRVNGFVKVAQVNGTLPSPPEAGMIVLDGTTFKGYNGSGWVNLN